MTTSMTAKDLDARFLQDALQDEAEVRQLYACRPGRFAVQAEQYGALQTAIRFIGDGKSNPEGFIRLLEIAHTKGTRRPLELSLEARYLAYAEQYAADYPELFPDATIKVAKDRLKALDVL
ncbi:MAG TPA: hypothetical protein PLM62_04500 [Zoogloea sp.]|nr:hypothetical protein [Zoogloea sp.]